MLISRSYQTATRTAVMKAKAAQIDKISTLMAVVMVETSEEFR